MKRRTLLKLAVLSAATPIIRCGGADDRPVIPAGTPDGLRVLLRRLDPSVAKRLLDLSGSYSEKTLLADFLVASLAPIDPVGLSPLLLVPDSGYVQPLDVDVQRRIVKAQSFRFFQTLQKTMILVYDSRSHDLGDRTSELSAFHDQVTTYLMKLMELLGFLPDQSWLHIQLLEKSNSSFTVGFNIFLSETGTSYPGIIAHELFHIYNSQWSSRFPLFITEGLADVASFVITGSTLSDQYVTSQPVHLSIMTRGSVTPAQYREETANGYRFFRSLLEEVGLEAYKMSLKETFIGGNPTVELILQAFKKWAPESSRVEAIYESQIAGYVPNSY